MWKPNYPYVSIPAGTIEAGKSQGTNCLYLAWMINSRAADGHCCDTMTGQRSAWLGALAAAVFAVDWTYFGLRTLLTEGLGADVTTILIIYPDSMTRWLGIVVSAPLSAGLSARWSLIPGRARTKSSLFVLSLVALVAAIRHSGFDRHLEANLAARWFIIGCSFIAAIAIMISFSPRGRAIRGDGKPSPLAN